jgi:hypothetical protein
MRFNRIETTNLIHELSDHDIIVFGDIDTIPTKSTQITRKIPLYKKTKYTITA